jgi:hypothetical protein
MHLSEGQHNDDDEMHHCGDSYIFLTTTSIYAFDDRLTP